MLYITSKPRAIRHAAQHPQHAFRPCVSKTLKGSLPYDDVKQPCVDPDGWCPILPPPCSHCRWRACHPPARSLRCCDGFGCIGAPHRKLHLPRLPAAQVRCVCLLLQFQRKFQVPSPGACALCFTGKAERGKQTSGCKPAVHTDSLNLDSAVPVPIKTVEGMYPELPQCCCNVRGMRRIVGWRWQFTPRFKALYTLGLSVLVVGLLRMDLYIL